MTPKMIPLEINKFYLIARIRAQRKDIYFIDAFPFTELAI
jgi:hypothetical protein